VIKGSEGTYSDTWGPGPGILKFQKTGERSYTGTWCDSAEGEVLQQGTMSFTVSEDGKTIAGTWEAGRDCEINPGGKGAIRWTREPERTVDADAAKSKYNQGVDCCEKGEYEKAIAAFTEAINLAPQLADAYHNRGTAYLKVSEYGRAIADLSKAIELAPEMAEAYNSRGLAHGERGNPSEAIADFTKSLRIDPDMAAAYKNRSLAYFINEDYDSAWADVHACQRVGGTVHPEFLAKLRTASGREE